MQACFLQFFLFNWLHQSTLLNTIIGRPAFASGVSIGTGMTTTLHRVVHCGVTYIDTPGLADTQKRDDAARAITTALRTTSGRVKLFFVVTLEAGRVRPADVSTMTSVLTAINDEHCHFGLIVNKLSSVAKSRITNTSAADDIVAAFAFRGRPPSGCLWLGLDATVSDADNAILHRGSNGLELRRFEAQTCGCHLVHSSTAQVCGVL